jgi:uridine monophosphate synthetase
VNNLGLVVGATHAEALARERRIAPELWILVPGVGAQGGDLHAVLQAGLRPDGLGLLITVSRSISRSANPGEVAEEMRQQINSYKNNEPQNSPVYTATQASARIAQLADELLQAGCIKFGEFKLKSGLFSPIYIDLRLLVSFPRLLDRAAKAYITILNSLSFDRLVGLPYAALPIATAISIQTGWPVIYPRKEAKSYGTMADIEGIYREGEKVVIIDDLATTGESKFEAIEKLKQARLKVEDVVVLIDRQSGANQALANAGYKLHAVATLSQLLDYYEASQKVAPEQTRAARDFISSSA